jgi:CRISPR/Cas system endoribonuclease Cas6 (RAMP superfamily)
MQSLAQFAFYAGVGHHTTIGMGQVRLPPANRK